MNSKGTISKLQNFVKYIQDSNLVYAFQRYFGVERLDYTSENGNSYLATPTDCDGAASVSNGSTVVTSHKKSELAAHQKNDHIVRSKFWYYVFSFGTSLGYEVFYASFFSFWIWNLNAAICRRVVNLWVFVMYIGQALKDIICWPRPSSPPVVHMEPKYVQEYGMPSTHAMVSVALPFSILYFSYHRYENFSRMPQGVLSFRLYMGMHTVLDLVGGLCLSPLLMIMYLPLADTVDQFQMKSDYSAILTLLTMVILQLLYPKSRSYTPARGDTSVIMGTGTGFAFGTWLNFQKGVIYGGPVPSTLAQLTWPSCWFICVSLLRLVIGLLCIVVARAIFKPSFYKAVCYVVGLDPKSSKCRQKAIIEMPYKFLTYIVIGFVMISGAPFVFKILGIDRISMYTES